jgi:ribonuclease H / adenosylcobalamin/alpha-ribazole phosphatase
VTRRLVVAADGGSRGNPGPAGYGALVTDASTGEVLAELAEALGTATNNVAEYSGLVAGLRAAVSIAPGADVEVRMDSRLVVEQMSGRWQIKDATLRSLAEQAKEATSRLGNMTYTWVPRARNAQADRLANQAMDGAAGQNGEPAGQVTPPARESASTDTDNRGSGWGQPQGKATTTLLLRHGQTALSVERRFAGRGDVPLTDLGTRQASAAATRLAARGGVDLVVSSPLARTFATAEVVAQATGAELLVDDDLVETDFGEWEGLTFAQVMARWPEEMAAWTASVDAAPPGGESLADAARRALAALDRLLSEHGRKTIAVVSHVTPIKTIVCRALLAPPAALFRINLDVGSLSEVDWYADGPALVRSLNDTAHLHSDGSRPARRGRQRGR